MKEDKTLTCCECGNEFVFTASEQEFYEEKGFTNEPRLAVKHANNAWAYKTTVRNAKCSPQFALNAVKRPWYRSNPVIVRFTAANASTHVNTNQTLEVTNSGTAQAVPVFYQLIIEKTKVILHKSAYMLYFLQYKLFEARELYGTYYRQ